MFTPFGRAKEMMAAIAAIMRLPAVVEREAKLHALGGYRSRGKGRGTPSRRYGNPPGAYMPHQGPHERAKRARNVARGLQSRGSIKLIHQR